MENVPPLKKSLFAKVSLITVINISVQIIAVIGFAINSKLYGPEAIGGFVVFSSYTAIISIVSTGYIEQAIYVDKRNSLLKYILLTAFYICILVSCVSYIILEIMGVNYIPFVIVMVLSQAITKIFTNLNISRDKILFNSISNLLFAPIVPVFYFISFKIFGAIEFNLILIASSSNIAYSIIMLLISLRLHKIYMRKRDFYRIGILLKIFNRYIDFTKFSMTGEFMRTLGQRVPTIIIEKYFGKEMAGFYGIANRIILMPTLLFIGTVSQLYMEKISNFRKQGRLIIPITKVMLLATICVSLLGLLLFFIFGKSVISILLGSEFANIYDTILGLIPIVICFAVISPLFNIFTIFEKQHELFKQKTLLLLASVIGFTYSVLINNYLYGIYSYSFLFLIVYLVYGSRAIKLIIKHDKALN